MNLAPLAAKIREPKYRGLSDQQLADAVNGLRVTVRRHVPCARARQEAIEAGYWYRLVDGQISTNEGLRGLCVNCLGYIYDFSGETKNVDMDRESVVAMRAALVQAGICSQAQADALSALADASIPWTESVGLGEVGIGLIQNARRL